VEGDTPARNISIAFFEWRVCGENVDRSCTSKVRCGNAVQQGVPFPREWLTPLRCRDLPRIAKSSAQRVHEDCGVDVQCRVLGQPRKSNLPPCGAPQSPGSTVVLQTSKGPRLEYLLCAHVNEDVWLCHRGTFVGNKFDSKNSFDPQDLVLRDILRDAWEDSPPATKRIRAHLHAGQLRNAAHTRQAAWDRLVAVATFRAEEIRAADQHRPCNEDAASSGFEQNSWSWAACDGRASHAEIAVLWSFYSEAGAWQQKIEYAFLHHVLSQRRVAAPEHFRASDVGKRSASLDNATRRGQSEAPQIDAQFFTAVVTCLPKNAFTVKGRILKSKADRCCPNPNATNARFIYTVARAAFSISHISITLAVAVRRNLLRSTDCF
jgi:hypothetical protein